MTEKSGKGAELKNQEEKDAIARNNVGVYYFSKGMYQEAIEEFKKSLSINPSYLQAQQNLKTVNKQTGIYDRAISAYRKVLQMRADDPEAYFNLGKSLSYTGEYAEAAKYLERALEINSEHILAQNLLGIIYKNTGEYEKAVDVFRKALLKYPNYAELRNNLGETLYKMGIYDEAEDQLKQAVKLNREYAIAYYNLSFVYGEVGRDEEAALAYNRAVEINPSFTKFNKSLVIDSSEANAPKREAEVEGMSEDRKEEAFFNLAKVYKLKGYTDDAITQIKRAITYNAKKPQYYSFFGELLIKKGLVKDAVEVFKQTLKLDPGFVEAKVNIGRAYREMKEFEKARGVLDAIQEENPDYPKLELERGIILYREDRITEAVKLFKNHLLREPYDDDARYYLGICYYKEKDYDNAIMELRRALELVPHYIKKPEVNLYLGLVLTDKGRNDEAIIEYQKALSVQPDNAVAHNSMGVAFKNLGNLDRAIEEYKRAVSIDKSYYKAYNNLGVAFYKKNFFQEAERYFKKALEIEPEYSVAKKNMDAAVKKDVVFRETIEKLKEKLKENTLDAGLRYDLANAYRNTGQLQEAIVEYRKVIELKPDFTDSLNNLGSVYIEIGDYDNAIRVFISAVSKGAGNDKAHFLLAQSYFKKDWLDEADIEYHKALEINQELEEVYFRLGEVYRKKAWWDEAIEMWKKYVEKNPDSETARLAQENIRMAELWKKELLISPSAGKKKLIK
jgi:tetratricopeptide (TPR) repeat protein